VPLVDSFFQKTQIINPEKRTVPPQDAFEVTAFKPWFDFVKIKVVKL
jgi:hypothetical protein